jgi:glycine oxidase
MPAQGRLERIGREEERQMATDGKQSYDALVVGGGAIGLACAWRAARRGLSVCLLERDRPGAGATGVAAGMLAPVGEASWGEENLLSLNMDSLQMWPQFARELEAESGRTTGFRETGALHVALDRDESEALRHRYSLHERRALDSEWLTPRQCRRLEPGLSPAVAGGILAGHEAAADAQALVEALIAALEASGGRLEIRAEVVEAELEGGAIRGVRTADGRAFRAGTIVLASGCWSGTATWLPAEARPPVRPVKGEILTLRGPASEPVCERIVASEWMYAVPRSDGRLIVGATVEERGFDLTVRAGGVYELLREAYRALPDVAELELAEALAGLRPGSPDNAPLIGATAVEGLLIATGHYRNGILLTPATAESIAALLAEEDPPVSLEPFSPRRFARAPRLELVRER